MIDYESNSYYKFTQLVSHVLSFVLKMNDFSEDAKNKRCPNNDEVSESSSLEHVIS
jgi:hypothetical protein